MSRIGILLFALILLVTITVRTASADTCGITPIHIQASLFEMRLSNPPLCGNANPTVTAPAGDLMGSGIIYLYANDEAKYSSLNNVLHAINELEGTTIQPGETFSFNQAAKLLQENIPYDLGPDVRNNLVKAGGVCMVSTMIATAAQDAGLSFVNARGKTISKPVPHSRYYKYYHQVNIIDNHPVPIVESSVSIKKDTLGQPWETVQDMEFVNNSGRVLVLHFESSFTLDDLDLAKPFGLIQENHTLKVQLLALPGPVDALNNQLDTFSQN